VAILEDAKSAAGDEFLVSLLPAAGDDGRPREPVNGTHVQVALALARRCDASLLPRLRAVVEQVARTRDGKADLEWFDAVVSKRTPAPPGGK
jgi:hypothetical protein